MALPLVSIAATLLVEVGKALARDALTEGGKMLIRHLKQKLDRRKDRDAVDLFALHPEDAAARERVQALLERAMREDPAFTAEVRTLLTQFGHLPVDEGATTSPAPGDAAPEQAARKQTVPEQTVPADKKEGSGPRRWLRLSRNPGA